jgi:hypothetical protein
MEEAERPRPRKLIDPSALYRSKMSPMIDPIGACLMEALAEDLME